jgi:uncharacterized protein YyaL (SSP411 family)
LLELHSDTDGRSLRASWAGRGHTRAYLEDVALLARACLDVHERTLEIEWLTASEQLAAELLDHYARDGGGWFETADDGETLIERTESQHDSPLPSGLAVAVEVLARLEHDHARTQIEQTLSRFHNAAARPLAHAALIEAAQWAGDRAAHVTIRASSADQAQALASAVRRARPTLGVPVGIRRVELESHATPDALVCRGQACSLPITDAAALVAALTQPAA